MHRIDLTNMNKKEAIFIKNKRRALQEIVGRGERQMPEYERLNMEPLMTKDVSKDFMNQKRIGHLAGPKQAQISKTCAVAPADHDQAWLAPMPDKD